MKQQDNQGTYGEWLKVTLNMKLLSLSLDATSETTFSQNVSKHWKTKTILEFNLHISNKALQS